MKYNTTDINILKQEIYNSDSYKTITEISNFNNIKLYDDLINRYEIYAHIS